MKLARVKIYSTGHCPFCERAKSCLRKWRIPFEELRVDQDRAALKEMLRVSNNARTVPQIVVDGRHIGGFSDLTELHMDGELDELVEA